MEVNVYFSDFMTTIDMSPMEFSVIPARGPAGADGTPGQNGTIENLNVTATTRSAGSSATATYANNLLTLGIPRGNTGATGNGISNIQKTGTSGLVDTYTITMTNGSTATFTVTNGDGSVTVDTALSTSSTNPVQNKAIATAVNAKANSADVYTKAQVDTALGNKANSADVYTKAQVDAALAAKPSLSDLLNTVYPVGSIYMSISNANPGTLFGGTWVSFGEGRVLVGVDPEDEDFESAMLDGGEKTHTLTEDELPNITGDIQTMTTQNTFRGGIIYDATGAFSPHANPAITYSGRPVDSTPDTAYATVDFEIGGGQAHNNMPPYITCYMWRRTA